MFTITWRTKAARQLNKIPANYRKIINDTVGTKLVDPYSASNVTKLTKHKYDYRLRIGNYRIFYNVIDGQDSAQMVVNVVYIEEVKPKSTTSYKKK